MYGIGTLILVIVLMLQNSFSEAVFIDCNGKGFYCTNSSSFLICVDMDNGLTQTVDDLTQHCPLGTSCNNNAPYECMDVVQYVPGTSTDGAVVNLGDIKMSNYESTNTQESTLKSSPIQTTGNIYNTEITNSVVSLRHDTLLAENDAPLSVEPLLVEKNNLNNITANNNTELVSSGYMNNSTLSREYGYATSNISDDTINVTEENRNALKTNNSNTTNQTENISALQNNSTDSNTRDYSSINELDPEMVVMSPNTYGSPQNYSVNYVNVEHIRGIEESNIKNSSINSVRFTNFSGHENNFNTHSNAGSVYVTPDVNGSTNNESLLITSTTNQLDHVNQNVTETNHPNTDSLNYNSNNMLNISYPSVSEEQVTSDGINVLSGTNIEVDMLSLQKSNSILQNNRNKQNISYNELNNSPLDTNRNEYNNSPIYIQSISNVDNTTFNVYPLSNDLNTTVGEAVQMNRFLTENHEPTNIVQYLNDTPVTESSQTNIMRLKINKFNTDYNHTLPGNTDQNIYISDILLQIKSAIFNTTHDDSFFNNNKEVIEKTVRYYVNNNITEGINVGQYIASILQNSDMKTLNLSSILAQFADNVNSTNTLEINSRNENVTGIGNSHNGQSVIDDVENVSVEPVNMVLQNVISNQSNVATIHRQEYIDDLNKIGAAEEINVKPLNKTDVLPIRADESQTETFNSTPLSPPLDITYPISNSQSDGPSPINEAIVNNLSNNSDEKVVMLQGVQLPYGHEPIKYDLVNTMNQINTEIPIETGHKTVTQENRYPQYPDKVECNIYESIPDVSTCHSYYVCRNNNQVRLFCPYNMVYSTTLRICTTDKNQCTINRDFICTSEGFHPDPISCYSYYECQLTPNGFKVNKYVCPWYSSYNAHYKQCVEGDSNCRNTYSYRVYQHPDNFQIQNQNGQVQTPIESNEYRESVGSQKTVSSSLENAPNTRGQQIPQTSDTRWIPRPVIHWY